MAHPIKYLPYKHKNLSSTPQNPHEERKKKNRRNETHLLSQHWGGKDRQTPVAHWPVSSETQTKAEAFVSKQGRQPAVLKNNAHVCLLASTCTNACTLHTCTHAYTERKIKKRHFRMFVSKITLDVILHLYWLTACSDISSVKFP